MRFTIAVVVLLGLTVANPALAVDPPGGKGWYQLAEDSTIIVAFEGGQLIIAGGTPGLFVGVTADGKFLIRFERGVATARAGGQGQEINSDSAGAERNALTQPVAPSLLKAFVRQPLSKATTPGARTGGGGAATLGPIGGAIGGSLGGTPSVNVARDATVVVDDTVSVVRRVTTSDTPVPDGRRPGSQIVPPLPAGAGGGGGGKPARVIAREEHDAWLAKVLALLGEDGARCETKGYGPGWVSICEPRGAA